MGWRPARATRSYYDLINEIDTFCSCHSSLLPQHSALSTMISYEYSSSAVQCSSSSSSRDLIEALGATAAQQPSCSFASGGSRPSRRDHVFTTLFTACHRLSGFAGGLFGLIFQPSFLSLLFFLLLPLCVFSLCACRLSCFLRGTVRTVA